MTTSVFDAVELAPRDPIFGLTEAYLADSRPGNRYKPKNPQGEMVNEDGINIFGMNFYV